MGKESEKDAIDGQEVKEQTGALRGYLVRIFPSITG